jgi:septum formation protein
VSPDQPPRTLILASTSPYRRALLERLGVPFRAESPGVDEEAFKAMRLSPRALAERLAEAKARALADRFPEAAILGGDQLACLGDAVLGKPGSREGAVEQLLRLSGRPHQLVTAMAVWCRGEIHAHTDVATLTMRPLARAEVERYVDADDPTDCAGAYKLERRGIALFERIEAADHSAITGLPLIALTTILRDLGFPIP